MSRTTDLWQKVGITAFWVTWPLSYVGLRGSMRTRLLVVCDNEIIVTKRWMGEGKWSLPGGGLHKQEDSLDGAVRELYEETRLHVHSHLLKRDSNHIYRYHGFRFNYVLFTCAVKHKSELTHAVVELTAARWINHKELTTQNSLPDVLDAVQSWWQ
jgi:8-oxo-dGTP pyrophosphatase MutT (NUDIX family)